MRAPDVREIRWDAEPSESFTIDTATTSDEVEAALAVRDDAYSEYLGISPRNFPDEDLRDQDGYLFVLRNNLEIVGSARVLPIDSPHVELRAFRQLPFWAEHDKGLCEISRVAARPKSGGVPYAWIGLILGAEWLVRYTDLRRYVAYARTELVDLYKVVGAWETGEKFQIPTRGPTVYSVVAGSIKHAASKGTALLTEATKYAGSASLSLNGQRKPD